MTGDDKESNVVYFPPRSIGMASTGYQALLKRWRRERGWCNELWPRDPVFILAYREHVETVEELLRFRREYGSRLTEAQLQRWEQMFRDETDRFDEQTQTFRSRAPYPENPGAA